MWAPFFQSRAYCDGLFSVQGAGAAMVVPLLDPNRGRPFSICAVPPGGKATAIAERMKDRGFYSRSQISTPRRLEILKKNTHRLGVTCVYPLAADARYLAVNRLFDRVLVDVPCSSLGIFEPPSRPCAGGNPIFMVFHACNAPLSNALLITCVQDGVLVYSTCTPRTRRK